MASELIAHEAESPIRARGIIVKYFFTGMGDSPITQPQLGEPGVAIRKGPNWVIKAHKSPYHFIKRCSNDTCGGSRATRIIFFFL